LLGRYDTYAEQPLEGIRLLPQVWMQVRCWSVGENAEVALAEKRRTTIAGIKANIVRKMKVERIKR
jgi:hypothetical protein